MTTTHYFHPTFLYESVWNLVGFAVLNLVWRKKKFDGQIFYLYIAWYGFGRMLIEGLRVDSLYVGVFRISQVIGFVCFVLGTVLLIVSLTNARREQLAKAAYEAAYPKLSKLTKESEPTVEDPADEEEIEEETLPEEELPEEDEDSELFEEDDDPAPARKSLHDDEGGYEETVVIRKNEK
jgi:phosphatidylglycerol:prolipoprotein diacylglycerol transferase